MKTSKQQTPVAFIDKTGYVTPFNGRMDTTLSGWYIYSIEDLKKALEQQRRLEEDRATNEREVVDTHYAIDDVEVDKANGGVQTEDDTPVWAKEMFGADNVVPFLQLENEQKTTRKAKSKKAKVVTADNMHQPPINVDLTPEQIDELQNTARTPADMVQQVLGG